MFKTIKEMFNHYVEVKKEVVSIMACLTGLYWKNPVEFNSFLLRDKDYRQSLLYKAIKGQPLGNYNFNRQAMKELIKTLTNNKLIQNVS